MKVVVNRCYGGFGLSDACLDHMGVKYTRVEEPYEHSPQHSFSYRKYENENDADYCINRTDPRLIAAIEALGSEVCSDDSAHVEVVNIPDNLKHFRIIEYDGSEYILASESEIVYVD